MSDTANKFLKLAMACLICVALATGLALLIQYLTR